MARRSLRPHLNQIRGWVRQGRTDAWIAHQLEVTVQQIETFKRENDLAAENGGEAGAAADFDDEIDLRAEDDALIAAELEAEQAAAADEEDEEPSEDQADEAEEKPKARRSRGRRGRGRSTKAGAGAGSFEGTFDHGEEGYGLWLDPAVEDNAVYAEHWAGHRPVEVTIEADRIVIRRTGDNGDDDE